MFQLKDEKFPVLGSLDRAESLVEWSKKQQPKTEFTKDPTLWGLILLVTANGEQPYIDYMVAEPTLKEFLSHLGDGVQMLTSVYGVTLGVANDEVVLHIPQDEDNVVSVFHKMVPELNDDPYTYLGRVHLSVEGPVFYSADEVEITDETTEEPSAPTPAEAETAPASSIIQSQAEEASELEEEWAEFEEELILAGLAED